MQFEVKHFVIYCSEVEGKQLHAAQRTPKKFFKISFGKFQKQPIYFSVPLLKINLKSSILFTF